jgi:hypothetical protein
MTENCNKKKILDWSFKTNGEGILIEFLKACFPDSKTNEESTKGQKQLNLNEQKYKTNKDDRVLFKRIISRELDGP